MEPLATAPSPATFVNPVIAGAPGEDHGDPFVIRYLDSYFLYHTGDSVGRRGVSVHRSSDLVHWEFHGYALEASESGWAWSELWAPEVVYERGVFYMYVSATRRRSGPAGPWDAGEGDERGRRLGIARATSPLGPFVCDDEPLVDEWAIDGHPFRDDDGSLWLFYNVRTDETRFEDVPGTGIVCDRLLAPDRLEGEPTLLLTPSQPWEGPGGDMYWNEGPFVLKRRGTYYQLYSGGFFGDATYGIGLARAESPRGPWRKDPDNPIVRSGSRIVGPGHNSYVFGPDVATKYAVYHGYVAGEEGRKVHIDRLSWAGDRPVIAGPTEGPQPAPAGPVHEPPVPHWRAEAWARGRWVEVAGQRFGLEPADVWHQVEAIQAGGRMSVRVGGVLRASRAVGAVPPEVAAEGDLTAVTMSSYLEDAELHELPARSEYRWQWGGAGALELSIAVRGAADLLLDDVALPIDSAGDGGFSFARIRHPDGAGEIGIRAGADGAAVTDLVVHARG